MASSTLSLTTLAPRWDTIESERAQVLLPTLDDAAAGHESGSRAVRACDVSRVKKEYRAMMRGPIRKVFQSGYRGELYELQDEGRVLSLASEKLPALETAIRSAMRGAVSRDLCARWSLYNSNLFPHEWSEHGARAEDSPVLLTLNCAPVDDGSACCKIAGAPLWTPGACASGTACL